MIFKSWIKREISLGEFDGKDLGYIPGGLGGRGYLIVRFGEDHDYICHHVKLIEDDPDSIKFFCENNIPDIYGAAVVECYNRFKLFEDI
jgi:hypothetical protein